ncbi:gluconokinase [Mesorhizobium sp. SB112]|uniref:gluconokinase n=1 Tax=Mesorhizobium sp. SB112 TaxID=3151853 RepID=UPI003264A438
MIPDENSRPGSADFLVVMGIAGTGKTEIASRLATALGCTWIEADRLHSAENVELMRQGIGLTDEQRWPWLGEVCEAALAERRRPVVIACSALRRRYRDFMRERLGVVRFLFLDGPTELIEQRLQARKSHFATTSLLASQLATLERPEDDEQPIRLDIALTPEEIVSSAVRALSAVHSTR